MTNSTGSEPQNPSETISGSAPTKVVPNPVGSPEEVKAWADLVTRQTAENMRKLPKDFIPKY